MAGYGTVQTFAKLSALATDSIESHQEFVKKHGLPFPLLSDSDQEIVKAYQVWAEKSIDGEKRMGTERTTYLIGPDRKIKAILKRVNIDEFHPQFRITRFMLTICYSGAVTPLADDCRRGRVDVR
jgi:peroxiredoxin